jgi:CRISPR-associated protein Cmr5
MSKGKHKKQKYEATTSATVIKVTRQPTNKADIPLSPPSPKLEAMEQQDAAPATGTLQQRRARYALEHVNALVTLLSQENQKKFNSYASAMPFMIHANGLGQTAAFYRRKGTEDIYYKLYELLGNWLSQPGQLFAGRPDLLSGITQSDMATYLAAQAEAMVFLDWVKKFASAFMSSD